MGKYLRQSVLFVAVVFFALSAHFPAFASDKPQTWEEKYKEEPYLVLRSERTVELRKDFTTVSTIRMMTKIQKESGKDQGEIPIHFDKSREAVKDIQAFTITPEGAKIKYRDIQELNPMKDYAVYSDERIKMITMPNVVAGSIIEWTAVVVSRKPLSDKNFFDMVVLSSTHPVKIRRYTLIVPQGIDLRISYMNTDRKPEVSHEGTRVIYTWELTEADKIEREEYMPPWADVAGAVFISTVDSWEALGKWTWNLFQKNLVLSPEMKTTVREITKDKKSQADRVQAIIDYIRQNFRYVSMNIEHHGYEPHSADRIFSNKYGDCKDYTLLGVAMLSEIGVKAYPVLFPSPAFGRAFKGEPLLPMPTYFNHAILAVDVDGTRHFTDLLIKGYAFNEIPPALSEMKVFLVNENGGSFDTVPRMDPADTITLFGERADIQKDGNAVIAMTAEFPQQYSVSIREQVRSMPDDIKQKFFSSFETFFAPGSKVVEREWKNLDALQGNVTVRLKYENPNWVQRAGDMMLFGLPQRKRPSEFSAGTRKHPIVFIADSKEEHRSTYVIPKNYKVAKLPRDVVLNYPFASFERTYRRDGNRIIGKELMVYKESRTPSDQYQQIKDFMDNMTKLTNDMVMIKKKK